MRLGFVHFAHAGPLHEALADLVGERAGTASGWGDAASSAGGIDRYQLVALGERLAKSTYGQYLLRVAEGH